MSLKDNKKTLLLAGNSNINLAKSISKSLGIPLCDLTIDQFANTETRIIIGESVRRKHVYIIQSGVSTLATDRQPAKSINDHLMDTLILVDACRRASAKSINVVLALYPYSRQDKKDRSRAPVSSSLVAGMLQTAGVDRLLSVELHADQIQGMFKIPVDNIFTEKVLLEKVKELTQAHSLESLVIVSPDAGGAKRAERFGKSLGTSVAFMHKQRDYSQKNKVKSTVLLGDVTDKIAILIDDMGDTCGTLCEAANVCKQNGVKTVIAVVTHGIFSGPALQRLNECNTIETVVTTNTISQENAQLQCKKIDTVDIGPLIGDIITRIANGESVSEIYN